MTIRRILLATTFALLAAACYHDNASPFVHGAKNDPRANGGTMVAPPSGRPAEGNPVNQMH
jgi:hypothetical protein